MLWFSISCPSEYWPHLQCKFNSFYQKRYRKIYSKEPEKEFLLSTGPVRTPRKFYIVFYNIYSVGPHRMVTFSNVNCSVLENLVLHTA